jgi:hypothetical protein
MKSPLIITPLFEGAALIKITTFDGKNVINVSRIELELFLIDLIQCTSRRTNSHIIVSNHHPIRIYRNTNPFRMTRFKIVLIPNFQIGNELCVVLTPKMVEQLCSTVSCHIGSAAA